MTANQFFPVSLEQRRRRHVVRLPRNRIYVDEARSWQRRFERNFRKRFVGRWGYAMVGKTRVGDGKRGSLRHVAICTGVCGLLDETLLQVKGAALFGVTGQTSTAKILRSFFPRRLHVRIMATLAAHLSVATPITLAKGHRVVMLEERRLF